MFFKTSPIITGACLTAAIMLIASCDSGRVNEVDSSGHADGSNASAARPVTGAAIAGDSSIADDGINFDFPEIVARYGIKSMTITKGPLPDQAALRSLSAGSGPSVGLGDAVVLRYDMFSWSTGKLVESSSELEGPYAVKAGLSDNIPEYLSKSLLGRTLGETVQIVFPAGMEDLPGDLDPADAHVMVVELM